MDLVPVRSQSIRAIGYVTRSRRLTVLFNTGYVYMFWAVPAFLYDAFLAAPPKGRFFNHRIRGQFPSARAA